MSWPGGLIFGAHYYTLHLEFRYVFFNYLFILAGSPFFERKSSRKPKCNSYGAIFYMLGRLFLYMNCLLPPPIPFPFKTIYDHPWLRVQTLSSNLHMTPVLLNLNLTGVKYCLFIAVFDTTWWSIFEVLKWSIFGQFLRFFHIQCTINAFKNSRSQDSKITERFLCTSRVKVHVVVSVKWQHMYIYIYKYIYIYMYIFIVPLYM
jgi:hypothetical protein